MGRPRDHHPPLPDWYMRHEHYEAIEAQASKTYSLGRRAELADAHAKDLERPVRGLEALPAAHGIVFLPRLTNLPRRRPTAQKSRSPFPSEREMPSPVPSAASGGRATGTPAIPAACPFHAKLNEPPACLPTRRSYFFHFGTTYEKPKRGGFHE